MSRLTKLFEVQPVVSLEEIGAGPTTPIDFIPEESFNPEEVKSNVEEQEKLEDVKSTLEEYERIIADVESEGTLKPVDARPILVSVEHFKKQLGLDIKVPSFENFLNERTSTEDLKSNIKAAIKATVEKLLELFQKLLNVLRAVPNAVNKGIVLMKTIKENKSLVNVKDLKIEVMLGGSSSIDEHFTAVDKALKVIIDNNKKLNSNVNAIRDAVNTGNLDSIKEIVERLRVDNTEDLTEGKTRAKISIRTEAELFPYYRVTEENDEPKTLVTNGNEITKLNTKVNLLLTTIEQVRKSSQLMGESLAKIIRIAIKGQDREVIDLVSSIGRFYRTSCMMYTSLTGEVESVLDIIKTTIGKTGENEETLKEIESISKNMAKFIREGDTLTIRTALRLELNYRQNTKESLLKLISLTEKIVPDLFEKYEVKSFAREIFTDTSLWTVNAFDMSGVWLKTNFSKERLKNMIDIREQLADELWS